MGRKAGGSGVGDVSIHTLRPNPWRIVGLLSSALVLVTLCLGCRYSVGHPPPAAGLRLGEVQVPVSEPAVGDFVHAALAAAIRSQGAAGERAINVRIEQASCEPALARDGHVHAWSAELSASFTLLGPTPRTLSLRRVATFEVPVGGMLSVSRSATFEELASALADEAVSIFLYAPVGERASTRGEP